MLDKTIQISKFNSPEEFRVWWENPETARIRQTNPGLLEAHPLVSPWLEQGAVSPEIKEEQFGKYRLISKLGQGGMGTVYLAYDAMLKRQIALKTLMLEDTESTARFMREARATAKLKHANIVNVYEAGVVGKTYYLTMDYIEGISLADMIKSRDKTLTPKRIAQIIHDVALALEYAHKNDIIHRDIKPGNILIDNAGHVYLTDFGLAKELNGLDRSLTMSGTALGTPDYMAPEQAMGKKDLVDQRSDVFSLGATLYHTLTGQVPFQGMELYEVLNKVVNHDPPTPSSIIVVHKDLETICIKCLDKDKSRRYQGMAELAEDLRRYIEGEPIQARRISAATKLWRRVQKNKTITISVAGAAVLLLAVIIELAISSGQAKERVEVYRAEAYRLFGEKKYDQALIACEKIREITTEDEKINELRQKCLAEVESQKALFIEKDERVRRRAEAKMVLDRAERAPTADKKIEIAGEALKIDPTFAEAYQLLGLVYKDKFDYSKAVECFSKAIEFSPELAYAYYERAMIMTFWDMPKKALSDLEMVLKYDPESYMGHFARGCIEGAQGKYDEAIESYTKVIKLHPNYSLAYSKRGSAYAIKNELDLAIADFTKAIRLDPKDSEAYNNRGLVYYQKKETTKAIADWTEVIRIDPKCAEAYTNRGNTYKEKGELDKAISDYTEAIRLDPKCFEVYDNRGNVYDDKGESDKAIADWTEAIRLSPKYVLGYYKRGFAYRRKGEIDKAITDWTEAIQLDPRYAEAYYKRGDAYKDMGELGKTIADWTEAIRLGYRYSWIYFNVASAYYKNGEKDKAITNYTETIRRDPKFADAYLYRGNIYYEKGNFNEAIADWTEVIRLNPKYANAYHNRSIAYAGKGMFKEAIADGQIILKLAPNHPEADQIKQSIKEWESRLK
ncbi:MAG: tetratricopeptide repeat protein [Planctomycetes bacterium]|nr:tetratricopeptide repeat protein [Planctomycetota bacterium]